MKWNDPVQYLKGVGEKRAEKLQKLEIATVGELLGFYPRAYIDYSSPYTVLSAPYNQPCAVKAKVVEKSQMRQISGGRSMLRVLCQDETANLTLVFFNNPYVASKLELYEEYVFYGKAGGTLTQRELISPSFVPWGVNGKITAVYPLTAGLKNHEVARAVANALDTAEDISETLPDEILKEQQLPLRQNALRMVHLPKTQQEAQAARRRFIFEELLCLQLGMLLLRKRESAKTGTPMQYHSISPLKSALPFALTNAQQRCIREICQDMTAQAPMNRLLQGDVGSGKTMVAAAAIYFAAKNGYQSVIMAPTEILANQHLNTLSLVLASFGIKVALLTGSIKSAKKKQTLASIASGEVQLIVGTHAVLSKPVVFKNLGLAVTDEQHRFGVGQRGLLAQKSLRPHLLVMSATPIPRTLALLMFGDLDVSVLDEVPKGRRPVKTRGLTSAKRHDMFGFIMRQIEEGRQAYIVCPLIEEGESDLQAVTAYAEEIAQPMLPKAKVGLMHGRLKAADKARIMEEFKDGKLDVLVSTTVIEVGMDVPNATVMVIENAERYGLSALHQLRGRVGRGSSESWCFLVSDHEGEAAKQRLSFMCKHQNGFDIARFDLETRGPGDFFGSRQHGLPTLRLASLATDASLVTAAGNAAVNILKNDLSLKKPQHAALAAAVKTMFRRSTALN